MAQIILQTHQLTKKYGRQAVVDNISITVEEGQILGVIGPNGSGKTTLFSMLLGLRKPTSGSMELFGKSNPEEVRKEMAAIMDQANFYLRISAKENLTISALTKGVSVDRVDPLLKEVGLEHTGYKAFQSFSYGMMKRLEIADALLTDPQLIIMDEPTNGLDPEGILYIRQLILDLKAKGKTVIISSHYLDEIEKVCTHFLILGGGKCVFHGTKEEVKENYDSLEAAFAKNL
jgi:ABC-type multidrug transport system ATPase subunit